MGGSRRNIFLVVIQLLFRFVELTMNAILWFIYGGKGEKLPPIENMILLDSAVTLALKIRTKKISSFEVVKSFIDRIKEINPILNCVIDERFDSALETARAVDEYLKTTTDSVDKIADDKPFLGVPFTTKDVISVKGLSLTAGLHVRKDKKAAEDSDVVSFMRNAGAIPIGITNVSELSMWWESYNTVYGRTNNPYNTNRIVGGSSGGEGCVLSAAGSPFGIGSDIGGSIRMPAFFNGVFGHKPSTGLVSIKGHYPAPKSDDQKSYLSVGPMSRFATDLMPMFKVICGKNSILLDLDSKVDIKKLKCFYMEDDGGSVLVSSVQPEIKNAVLKVADYLQKTHGVPTQKLNLPKMKKSTAIWMAKMQVPSGPQMPVELLDHQGRMNPFAELFKIPLGLSIHTIAGTCVALTESMGGEYGDSKHTHLVEMCGQLRRELEDALGDNGVLIYPTHPTAAPYHNEPLFKPFNFSYTAIFNVLGFPATHCPMGLNSEGLPIGVQVVASRNQDRLTLALALELEKAFGGWVPPSVIV